MKKYVKYLALAVTLVLMGLIFYFSAQPGSVSYKVSEAVTQTVQAGHKESVLPQWFSKDGIHANIRKWAHICIYCALGISMAATVHLWTKKISLWQQTLLAAALCMLYAVSDELHQHFVPGRTMLLSDVGVDALGFLSCIAGAFLAIWLWQKAKRKEL